MQQIFADGLGSLSLAKGVVRIELAVQGKTSQKASSDEAQSALIPAFTLNMPVEGFANMVPFLQQLIVKLEKDGALKRQDTPSIAKSPNFN